MPENDLKEPSHEKEDLSFARLVHLHTCIDSHSLGPDFHLFVIGFLQFHILGEQTLKALVRLWICRLA